MKIAEFLKQIFAKEDLRTDDKLGVYPEKVHVPAFLERRYLKTSRILGIIAIISMCINIILGSYLFMQPSMVKSHPVGFAYNNNFGGFKELEKIYVKKPASEMIYEEKIREYIYIRHRVVPDVERMEYTWQAGSKFYWMSGKSVYGAFKTNVYPKVIELINTTGYRQDVFFRGSRKIKGNRWVAEFDTYEYFDWQDKKAVRKRWRAYLQIGINNAIPYETLDYKLRNPLNVNIYGYYLVSIAVTD